MDAPAAEKAAMRSRISSDAAGDDNARMHISLLDLSVDAVDLSGVLRGIVPKDVWFCQAAPRQAARLVALPAWIRLQRSSRSK